MGASPVRSSALVPYELGSSARTAVASAASLPDLAHNSTRLDNRTSAEGCTSPVAVAAELLQHLRGVDPELELELVPELLLPQGERVTAGCRGPFLGEVERGCMMA